MKKMMKRNWAGMAGVMLTAVSLSVMGGTSWAQSTNFPDRTIKMVVPYPPGGATDNLARVVTQELAKVTGVPVIVENKPGGGTTVGALAVKNSPADGYTLLFQADGLFYGKLSSPQIPYEFEDFEIMAPLSQSPYALLTNTASNINSLEDLKKLAQKKNGELTIGTLGTGVSSYSIMGNALGKALGFKPIFIPYKGGAQGVNALMAGDVDLYFATVGLSRSAAGNERIKVLATTGEPGFNKFLTNVPSFADLGVPELKFFTLYGVAVRADTPAPIKDQLRQILNNITTSDAMKKSREQVSLEDYPGSLEDYKKEVADNVVMYKKAFADNIVDK